MSELTKDTPVCELMHSDDMLMHYGVKGMKWGVRKAVVSTGGGRSGSKGSTSGSAKNMSPSDKKKVSKQCRRGKRFADKFRSEKAKALIGSATSVAAGALWVASAFIPGNIGGVLNGAAAVANIVSVASTSQPTDK